VDPKPRFGSLADTVAVPAQVESVRASQTVRSSVPPTTVIVPVLRFPGK